MTEDVNLQFSCGNDESTGLVSVLVSFENMAEKQVNIFTMFQFNKDDCTFHKKYQTFLKGKLPPSFNFGKLTIF
jgi:hypothetical protein